MLNLGQPIAADELRGWLLDAPEHSLGPSPSFQVAADDVKAGLNLDGMERKLIESALERFGGHRAKTAEALGIGIRTLSGKLKSYGYAPRSKTWSKAG